MSGIGHNSGETFKVLEIEKGTDIHNGIMQYLQDVSQGIRKVIIPTTYIKEGGDTFFQYSSDTIIHFTVEGTFKIIGVTTCVPKGFYNKIKQAA